MIWHAVMFDPIDHHGFAVLKIKTCQVSHESDVVM